MSVSEKQANQEEKMAKFLSSLTKLNSNVKKPFTIVVEGNIGSGKTTFLNRFKKYDNVCILSEPVELWRNCNNHNLLENVYKDTSRWGFTFQSYVQLTMLNHHVLATPHPIKFMERSIYSAKYCFVEKMYRDGILPAPSAAVLNEWFKWITHKVDIPVDLIVYLRSTPEVVYQRMLERNRSEERSVSLQFLKDLHEMHEDWLFHKTLFTCPAPVITLNADLDKSIIEEEYQKCESHVYDKFTAETIA